MKEPYVIEPLFSALGRKRMGRAIIQATGCGPYDGGCVVFAEALRRKVGGTLRTLRSNEGAEHAILDYKGMLVDFEGAMTERAMIGNFHEWQLAVAGHHSFPVNSVGDRQPEDFQLAPFDEDMVAKVQQALPANIQERLDKAAVKMGLAQAAPGKWDGLVGGLAEKLRIKKGAGAERPTPTRDGGNRPAPLTFSWLSPGLPGRTPPAAPRPSHPTPRR